MRILIAKNGPHLALLGVSMGFVPKRNAMYRTLLVNVRYIAFSIRSLRLQGYSAAAEISFTSRNCICQLS